jgi:hypothetical protein
LGGLQTLGGVAQVVGGAGLCTTIVGCLAGGPLVLRGLDDVQAGVRAYVTGEHVETFTYQATFALTGSPTAAFATDLTTGLISPSVAAGTLIKTARAARLTRMSSVSRAINELDDALRVSGISDAIADSARAISPASEGVRISGRAYTKLDALERRLAGWGIKLERDADEVLDEIGVLTGRRMRALFSGFDDGTGVLTLRAGATRYEVLHELSHILDFRRNPSQWIRAASSDALANALRETAVYNRLRGSRSWWKLSFPERLDALRYVQRLRRELNLPSEHPWTNTFKPRS